MEVTDNMKTAILSMQRIDNYGSLLQAYALKKIIESFGGTVDFMDIKKINADNALLGTVNDHKKRNADKYLLKKLFNKDIFIRVLNKKKIHYLFDEFKEFRKSYLEIDRKSDNYDLCIIGSDEVFNCLDECWWGYTSQLFGNVPEANSVITYAASCGSTKIENVPKSVRDSIGKAFKNVVSFSVRDDNTKSFVNSFGITDIEKNLDPVLIYDFEKELSEVSIPSLPEHYCIIYSYLYRFYNKEEINSIMNFCKSNNLTPILLQGAQSWCRNLIVCNPFQCLKIFQNADFVITDTFHGTIFSLKFAKKFAVIKRQSNQNKLDDLIRTFNVENHCLNDWDDLRKIYEISVDKENVRKVIHMEHERTIHYLSPHLSSK